MRKIATSVLAATVGSIALTVPAQADSVGQFCVDFGDNGVYSAHLAEDYASWEAMRGHRYVSFPNSAVGCGAFSSGDGEVFNGPNPYPAPEEPCEPEVVVREVRVEVPGPVRIVETSSVQTTDNPELIAKIKKQRATIKRLRARLAAKR